MKIKALLITCALLFLTACATSGPGKVPPENVLALTEPTQVEGPHKNVEEVMLDPRSVTADLLTLAGALEDALSAANADKDKLRKYLAPQDAERSPPRWMFWRRREED